jgi:hypothetical protein
MATYTLGAGDRGAYAKALVAATVDTVDLDGTAPAVEIVSSGSAAIYVTVDGTAPTVGGAKTWEIPAGTGPIVRTIRGNGIGLVKLISSGTPTYSVTQL